MKLGEAPPRRHHSGSCAGRSIVSLAEMGQQFSPLDHFRQEIPPEGFNSPQQVPGYLARTRSLGQPGPVSTPQKLAASVEAWAI